MLLYIGCLDGRMLADLYLTSPRVVLALLRRGDPTRAGPPPHSYIGQRGQFGEQIHVFLVLHPQVVEVAEVDAVDAVGRLRIVADAFLAEHKIIDRPQHRLVLDEV